MEVVKTIGRSTSNDVVIKHAEVSEFQAQLIMRGQYFFEIEDLESKKGTFVNNQRITGKQRLFPGDILSFGDYIFEFESIYPPFLGGKPLELPKEEKVERDTGDFSAFEEPVPVDDLEKYTSKEVSLIAKWLETLKYPKDRRAVQRRWFLVVSSIMLLTIVVPYLSWGNYLTTSFYKADASGPHSGIMYLFEILNVQAEGGSFIKIVSLGVMFLTVLGTIILSVLFFLFGLQLWRPKSIVLIQQLAQVQLGLFVLVFLKEFLRYVSMWMSGEGMEAYVKTMMKNSTDALLLMESFGIGFWICFIGSILLYRSTRNKLWRPEFGRKWVTLSFTFWIPVLIFLTSVHQSIGLIQSGVDKEEYKGLYGVFSDRKIETERLCQTAPSLVTVSYVMLGDDIRSPGWYSKSVAKLSATESDRRAQEVLYMRFLWIVFHLFLFVLLFQLFYRKINGNVRLVAAGFTLLLTLAQFYLLRELVEIIQARNSSHIFSVSVGYGAYIMIVFAMGLVAEQLYYRLNSKPNLLYEETPIDHMSEEDGF